MILMNYWELSVQSRTIWLVALVALFILVDQSAAQTDPEPKDGKVVYPIALTPKPYLKPISRVYLLPELREAIPGNRVQMFLRCFMEQDNFFGRAESEKREKWNQMPLKDLPVVELKNYGGRLIESDMYDAARMTNVDWQVWYFVRRDGYYTLLPDVQKMRALASALKTRIRGEIAAGDIEGAIHDLKTFFGLAKTLEAHPTMIGQLVGVAIATIAVNALEELIQQPNCPNLFWALTDLPSPFLSLRAGLEGERMFVRADFEEFDSATIPLPDSVVLKKIDRYEKLLDMEEGKRGKRDVEWKASLQARAADGNDVKAARTRLIEAGLKPENVKVWSPLHVVLLDEVMLYERMRDDVTKSLNLPFWRAKPAMVEAESELKKAMEKSRFLELISAFFKVKQAQTRLDQRIAYLQIMEALRLYALQNGGSLPASLAEIKLPLPVDPFTGKPFEYSVKDGIATLHGENPLPGSDRLNRYYEIQIKQ